jgi:hypothetical protein
MKEHVEKKDAALEELEGQASYLESTKQGEDPHAVATEWWERAYEA